jgi:hypothetical protein
MLSGAPPFVDGDDVNIFAVLNRIGSGDVPDLRARGVSGSVADAVRHAMAKAPEDRPASAAELAELLAAGRTTARTPIVEPEPPAAEPAPPPAAPAPVVEAERSAVEPEPLAVDTEPHPDPEPVVAPARTAAHAAATRAITTPVIVAVAAVVVSFIGASQRVTDSQSWLDVDYVRSMQVWFPMLVLLAAVLFFRSPGTAAEWVIGAGTAFVGVSFVSGLMSVTYQIVENDSTAGWASLVLRTAGAIVAVVGVVLAWRVADHEGPPFPRAVQAMLVAAAGVVFFSTRRATDAWFSDKAWYRPPILLGTVVLLAVLLYRVFRLPASQNAAPALVAAGVMGAVLWALEIRIAVRDDIGEWSVDAWMAAGYAALAVVGVWRWVAAKPSSPAT